MQTFQKEMRNPRHFKDESIIRSSFGPLPIDKTKRTEVDLGCGEGSFAISLAKMNPDAIVIAVDLLKGRLRKLCLKRLKTEARNLLIVESRADFFLEAMTPDASIDVVHLLCPDPWPKSKHRAQRLLSSEFSGLLSRKLKDGGVFHFSSDDENYCRAAERIMSKNGAFEHVSETPGSYQIPRVESDFESKWISSGRRVRHIFWEKRRRSL